MNRVVIAAVLSLAAAPAFSASLPGRLGMSAAGAQNAAASLPPNFGRSSTALTLSLPGIGKGGLDVSQARTLPALGTLGLNWTNTGKGGDVVIQLYNQSPKAVAKGDAIPGGKPAAHTGVLPPLAVNFDRVGGGFGAGSPLFAPPLPLPVIGTAQLSATNAGASGRSTLSLSYTTATQ